MSVRGLGAVRGLAAVGGSDGRDGEVAAGRGHAARRGGHAVEEGEQRGAAPRRLPARRELAAPPVVVPHVAPALAAVHIYNVYLFIQNGLRKLPILPVFEKSRLSWFYRKLRL